MKRILHSLMLFTFIIFFVAIPNLSWARTVVTIDRDSKAGNCLMRADRGDDTAKKAIEQLFASLNVPDQGRGLMKIKSFKTPDGLLVLECQIVELAGITNCSVTVLEGAHSVISKSDGLYHYWVDGAEAETLSKTFLTDDKDEYLFESPDGHAAFFVSPNKFVFKARVNAPKTSL